VHSNLSGIALVVCLGTSTVTAATAQAQPKTKTAATEVGGDKSIEKQSAWEQEVMGEDSAKQAEMKKIAAAQRLGEQARKNPPPEPVKKSKDPSKEGVHAKSEASIGLPIESEEAQKSQPKKSAVARKVEPSSSANDELGALVAASLASEKKSAPAPTAETSSSDRGRKSKASKGKAAANSSSLDRMFASP
jgi:hypothetical protein